MSLFNSFDRNKHLEELATPLLTQGEGVISPTTRRTRLLTNIAGTAMTAAQLAYLAAVTAGTGAASKAVVLDSGEDYTWPATGILTYGVLKDPAGTTLTATAAELNYLDADLATNILTKGTGVSATESYSTGIARAGGLIITRIVVDLTGLVGSATDLDIIGNTGGAANANWGQITTAKSGTIIAGSVQCLEVPAGGSADIDFYSATVATGAQDVDVTTLVETALVTSGGAWTNGLSQGMTALPPANDYLYIVNGAASGGTFSAGKFLITLYGA